LKLTIEKLVYGGDGLARLPADEKGRGKAVFLPFVLEGEEVEAALVEQKPGFARARLDSVIQASAHRVDPACPYFGRCGGCHYQHSSYEHQLEIKAGILRENLRRIAKLELAGELAVHASPPWNYRNRTRLKVGTSPTFALGYFKFNSHEFLAVEKCPISSPLINRALVAITVGEGSATSLAVVDEIEFFASAEDSQLLVELYCAPRSDPASAKKAADWVKAIMPESVGVTAFTNAHSVSTPEPQKIVTVGDKELTYRTKRALFRVGAGAFFQVNRHLTDDLISIVTEGRSGNTALDLYAGVGLFSTVLSREFERVLAVESSPTSQADLAYNSPRNVKAVRSTSEEYLKNVSRKLQPDLVVVDPPRGGLGESVVHALVTLGAPRITYVSCDPATLSRDLGGLLKAGYEVERAHMVDLFPQTYHLETVFHLVR
jgi:23S rRNA (uracil1939-C5)-methyltransferase